jgi:hypothetical protein
LRDKIFISHARPEDDEFTRWLALQLIREGYPVWCDLIKLKGGEDFWKDIQAAIENRAVKFLYVLSRISNEKEGPLMELAAARAVQKRERLKHFVIPLAVDDLPADEYAIELRRINSVTFNQGWAKGLSTLLEKLEEDRVAKSVGYGASAVADWWHDQFSSERGVVDENEDLLSNWFPLDSLPEYIYHHLLYAPPPVGQKVEEREPDFPYRFHLGGILSFADRDDFAGLTIKGHFVADTYRYKTQDLLDGKHSRALITGKTAREVVVHLLGVGWNKMAERRSLSPYEMANQVMSYHFVGDQVEHDRINFTDADGHPAYKYIMGYKRVGPKGSDQRVRHWHYAVSAKASIYPFKGFSVRGHVLFSDDAKTIWDSAERIHKARMSQCKSWWNRDWRDRMLATMYWLDGDDGAITIPLGSETEVKVDIIPLIFESPFSFIEPGEESSAAADEANDSGDDELEFDEDDQDYNEDDD